MVEPSLNSMSEAEVSLRLAIYLAHRDLSDGPIQVAIDGAQVKVKGREIFALRTFLEGQGWKSVSPNDWKGIYSKSGCRSIEIHSRPGIGDVVGKFANGKVLRAEAKKGPLSRSASSKEYPLMREAIGQLMTISEIDESTDILAIAVPNSDKFRELADRWRVAPLMKRLAIHILLVDRDGSVVGF